MMWLLARSSSFVVMLVHVQTQALLLLGDRGSRRALAVQAGSRDDVGAQRRALEAQFGKTPADPKKTMEFLRRKGLVGDPAAAARQMDGIVDEAGAVADLVEREAIERCRSTLEDGVAVDDGSLVLDDMSSPFPRASRAGSWTASSDQVMGGLSTGIHERAVVADARGDARPANRLAGRVTTANNGGFISMSLDLGRLDASSYAGVRVVVRSPTTESYSLHLRTPECARVFSSYRSQFDASPAWSTVDIPWVAFRGHGPGATERPLDTTQLMRASLLAIGRDFDGDLAVADVRLFKAAREAADQT